MFRYVATCVARDTSFGERELTVISEDFDSATADVKELLIQLDLGTYKIKKLEQQEFAVFIRSWD